MSAFITFSPLQNESVRRPHGRPDIKKLTGNPRIPGPFSKFRRLEKPSGDEAPAPKTKKIPRMDGCTIGDAPKIEDVDVKSTRTLRSAGIFVKHFRKAEEKKKDF